MKLKGSVINFSTSNDSHSIVFLFHFFRLTNSVVVLMILVGGSQLSNGEKLNCQLGVFHDFFVAMYSCLVTSLDNPHNNLTINGHSGQHNRNMNDADVRAIRIFNTNTKYIPTNLGSLFSNLFALEISNSELVEFTARDFHGMQDLEIISFYANKLSTVPLSALSTLTKLRIIVLSSNQIEELPSCIFASNLRLEDVLLDNNKIKFLGTGFFNGLVRLNYVGLRSNICISDEFYGATQIIQLKKDIRTNCKNPNECSAMTTTTTATQNTIEVKLLQEQITKLEKELREAKELLQKNEDALKKKTNCMR